MAHGVIGTILIQYFVILIFICYFSIGHGTDYLNLAIRDGGVSLTMGLSNGKQEMHIKPARVRFDDHQWHRVTVHRRIQEISSITSFCRVSCCFVSWGIGKWEYTLYRD